MLFSFVFPLILSNVIVTALQIVNNLFPGSDNYVFWNTNVNTFFFLSNFCTFVCNEVCKNVICKSVVWFVAQMWLTHNTHTEFHVVQQIFSIVEWQSWECTYSFWECIFPPNLNKFVIYFVSVLITATNLILKSLQLSAFNKKHCKSHYTWKSTFDAQWMHFIDN